MAGYANAPLLISRSLQGKQHSIWTSPLNEKELTAVRSLHVHIKRGVMFFLVLLSSTDKYNYFKPSNTNVDEFS